MTSLSSAKTVSIVGAGGHARSVISLLERNDFAISGLFDDSFVEDNKEWIGDYKLQGKLSDIPQNAKLILAVGDNLKRKDLFEKLNDRLSKETIFHPSSIIEKSVILGSGNLVFAGAIINSFVRVGENNILNSGCILEHEVKIGDHNHISVGAIICGRSVIGNGCFIGAGAVIIDGLEIGNNITIGANSVVVNSLSEPGVYAGNPVRKIK